MSFSTPIERVICFGRWRHKKGPKTRSARLWSSQLQLKLHSKKVKYEQFLQTFWPLLKEITRLIDEFMKNIAKIQL